jgi:uncharacterized protein (DUF4415 family)
MSSAKPEKRVGGRPAGSAKVAISIRLDADVVAKFKATGPGWQSRIDEALKRHKISPS